ncbi:MAG: hemolysin III family protein [Aquificales bacterium]|nr:hemolysin III family protein [Aquificales bacterium]
MSLFRDKPNWKTPFYSRGEEIANSITHGIGTALSIAGLSVLVVLAVIYGDVWRIVSFSIYGGSLILLYLASTLYHSLQHPRVKQVLRKFDHASIYILIAGTYTPFLLISMRGSLGWPIFGLIWGLAAAGIVWKMFFVGKWEVLATIIYILMGWMCIFLFKDMVSAIPPLGVTMLITGGVVYTAGVIFYAWEKLPYNHAIWHLFVLGGSVCHFVAISTLIPA